MSRKTVSMIGNLTRDMMSDVMETSLKKPIQTGEFRKNPVEPAWRCPAEYIYELVKTEQFVMEYLKPKQAVTGRVILQLHGGGYIGPMKNIYRRFAVKYSQISFGADVLTPDYRVAPEHPYPAALEDAVYAYRWLLEEKKYQPSQIVVAGDSAGGGLALALCLYAKDHGLPLPAGIITMSPWTDVSLSGASYEENYTIDPLFGNSKENMLYQCSYIGNANPKNPYLSPLFGDFEGFPPMLIQVGSYEMLLSDSVDVAAKARGQGVKVRLSIYDGMFHIFQMAAKMLPESRKAWVEIGKFIEILLREGSTCLVLRQVAHIHVYRQTVVIGDLRFAENQRSKIVEQRLFDVVAGTVDPLSRNALCLVGDLADFRIGVIHGIRCV